jgi:hypothetical protein
MKIDQQNIASAASSQAAAVSPAAGQRNSSVFGGSGDQAELSGLSRAIQSFQSDRTARLDKLTALVRSGKYEANPAQVSSAIVSDALSSNPPGSQAAGAVAR